MDSSTRDRIKWVDAAKFVAIIAVLIDHTNEILYSNTHVLYFSYYSVSLFIITMGITTVCTYNRNRDPLLRKIWQKCIGIMRPYSVATIIYAVFLYKFFDFEIILNHLIRFDMRGPFYYVLLYIQLVLISPIFIYIFEKADEIKWGYILEIATFLAVLLIAGWTTNFSNILDVYGGGGKLFGGTYLILFYIGMWFGRYYSKISVNKIVSGIFSMIACIGTIAWWRFIAVDRRQIDLNIPFGEGFNPPSISFGIYAILIATTLFFLEKFLLNYPNCIPMKIMEIMAFMGKHTLYIFLYHMFFLDIILPKLDSAMRIISVNVWVKRVVWFTFMIGGSMVIEFFFEKIHRKVVEAYRVS